MKVVSIYPGYLYKDRGTPIRVRSILATLSKYTDISLTTCSLDLETEFSNHVLLQDNKLQNFKIIYTVCKKIEPDVVIGHTIISYIYLVLVKILLRRKITLEMHGFVEEEARLNNQISFLSFVYLKLKYGVFYRMCDFITTCSPTATRILKRYNSNIETFLGGSDLSVFNRATVAVYDFKEKPDDIVIGYAGNARIWQGLDFLIETFTELHERNPRFKLALLVSEKNGIAAHPGLKLVPGVSYREVPGFLASCDILMIPRMKNYVNDISFASKLPEYMAMEKCVVASRTSDTFEVISDGENGFLFDPGDKKQLIALLEQLQDKNLRERVAKKAHETILTTVTWDEQVKKYYQLLKHITRYE